MGASGPRRKRKASSASRLFPFDSRNRGVSGMKHMATIISDGGREQQIASQRQSMNRPAGRVQTVDFMILLKPGFCLKTKNTDYDK
ncbi:hypothetical protein GOODEAATRI_020011, partial [Goodea atripinnis]